MFDFPSLFGPMRIAVFPTIIFLAVVMLRYFCTVNDLSFIVPLGRRARSAVEHPGTEFAAMALDDLSRPLIQNEKRCAIATPYTEQQTQHLLRDRHRDCYKRIFFHCDDQTAKPANAAPQREPPGCDLSASPKPQQGGDALEAFVRWLLYLLLSEEPPLHCLIQWHLRAAH